LPGEIWNERGWKHPIANFTGQVFGSLPLGGVWMTAAKPQRSHLRLRGIAESWRLGFLP
jgi:hypothetical protein